MEDDARGYVEAAYEGDTLNYRVAADPSIHGCVEHLLAIAVKPA